MTHRILAAAIAVMAVAALAPAGALGQTQASESSGWTSSRTAWGDPGPARDAGRTPRLPRCSGPTTWRDGSC